MKSEARRAVCALISLISSKTGQAAGVARAALLDHVAARHDLVPTWSNAGDAGADFVNKIGAVFAGEAENWIRGVARVAV